MALTDSAQTLAKVISRSRWRKTARNSQPAFEIPNGCYQFKRMPFGLVNSVSVFNHMMRKMLHQVKNIEHYVGHVLVHTAIWMEHMTILQELFNRIRKASLSIHPSKSYLGYSSLEFVDHTLRIDQTAIEDDELD